MNAFIFSFSFSLFRVHFFHPSASSISLHRTDRFHCSPTASPFHTEFYITGEKIIKAKCNHSCGQEISFIKSFFAKI